MGVWNYLGKIKNIKAIYFKKDELDDSKWAIETDGSNLTQLLGCPIVDGTRTICNNMWDIYQSDIFNAKLNIKTINVDDISKNLREYKRIFGKPPIPDTITPPNKEQQKLLKLIHSMYYQQDIKFRYKNKKFVIEIANKSFNSWVNEIEDDNPEVPELTVEEIDKRLSAEMGK